MGVKLRNNNNNSQQALERGRSYVPICCQHPVRERENIYHGGGQSSLTITVLQAEALVFSVDTFYGIDYYYHYTKHIYIPRAHQSNSVCHNCVQHCFADHFCYTHLWKRRTNCYINCYNYNHRYNYTLINQFGNETILLKIFRNSHIMIVIKTFNAVGNHAAQLMPVQLVNSPITWYCIHRTLCIS